MNDSQNDSSWIISRQFRHLVSFSFAIISTLSAHLWSFLASVIIHHSLTVSSSWLSICALQIIPFVNCWFSRIQTLKMFLILHFAYFRRFFSAFFISFTSEFSATELAMATSVSLNTLCQGLNIVFVTRSLWGRRDDMPPPADGRQFDGGKNRGGSTSVRGRVRSLLISAGRWWLSCRQPACL